MKKAYIKPEMDIVMIGTAQLLAGSSINVGNDYNGTDEVLAPEYEWWDWQF